MHIHNSGRKIDAKQTQPILAVFPNSLFVLILKRALSLSYTLSRINNTRE